MSALSVRTAQRRYRRAQRHVERARERITLAEMKLGEATEKLRWANRVKYLRDSAIRRARMVANDGSDEF